MIALHQNVIDECHGHWNPTNQPHHNKVHAIKYLRGELGVGLKEAKDLVEHDFDNAICKMYNVRKIDTTTPGYYIDRIFELAGELSQCYDALQQMGFHFNGGK